MPYNFRYKSRQWSHPTGYKYLAIYKNAEIVEQMTRKITAKFPRAEHRMVEQMNDAARSFKVNIVEGWKRPTTREYLNFLGYSQASLAELTDNAEDFFKHKFISLADYEEYYGWLKKSDFLMNRLVAALESKMAGENTINKQDKCRMILEEQKRKQEEGRKLFGFDKLEEEIKNRNKGTVRVKKGQKRTVRERKG